MAEVRFNWVLEDSQSCMSVQWRGRYEGRGPGVFVQSDGGSLLMSVEEWEELKAAVDDIVEANQ